MEVHVAIKEDVGGGREIVLCLLWRGMLEQSVDGKITYEGGSRKSMVLKEAIMTEKVQRMVMEIIGSDFSKQKVLYNLKSGQTMLMPVEGDADVRMIFKGNDEHDSLYMGGVNGPRRRVRRAAAECEGRMHTCVGGMVCGTSRVKGMLLALTIGGWR